jgi:NAD(P)-dependent dehydrogenase (short-subunit alcohol dehydrogenase family)
MSAKTIVITGCTRGLGRAMTDEFIRLGHRVGGCGRTAKAIAGLNATSGSPHYFAGVDVTDAKAVGEFARRVLAELGPPDLLLNNAALINQSAPLWEVPVDEFSTVIDVNIKGVHNVIRSFLPAMMKQKSGVIVNFSSGWGRSTSPQVAPYCATKWAIEGLTQALAKELPRGMAAVAFNPGVIDTAMLRTCWGEGASTCPSPDQWAKTAVPFLLNISARDSGTALSLT